MAPTLIKSRGRAIAAAVAAAALWLAASAPALAVVIENQDDVAYHYTTQELEIGEKGEVAANSTTEDLCRDCSIVIRTIGSFFVSGNDRIVIKDGEATVVKE